MTLFWILCAALLVLALSFLVWPLWRKSAADNSVLRAAGFDASVLFTSSNKRTCNSRFPCSKASWVKRPLFKSVSSSLA